MSQQGVNAKQADCSQRRISWPHFPLCPVRPVSQCEKTVPRQYCAVCGLILCIECVGNPCVTIDCLTSASAKPKKFPLTLVWIACNCGADIYVTPKSEYVPERCYLCKKVICVRCCAKFNDKCVECAKQ